MRASAPLRFVEAPTLAMGAEQEVFPMTIRPDPTFHASPKLAMEAPPENFAYTLLLSPDFSKPDALAVIDVKSDSPTFSQIVHTVTMPSKGDEFHLLAGMPARRHCRRSPATRSSSGAT